MKSLEELHRAWQQVTENRISAAQEEGAFESLRGLGRLLEKVVEITDPNGWIRRTLRESRSIGDSSTQIAASAGESASRQP